MTETIKQFCVQCGKAFEAETGHHGPVAKYCSERCSRAAAQDKARAKKEWRKKRQEKAARRRREAETWAPIHDAQQEDRDHRRYRSYGTIAAQDFLRQQAAEMAERRKRLGF